MNTFVSALAKVGLLREDLDYQLIRASMVIMFFFFGYQKWFDYEAEVLIPYISNGPLISWLYPVFGIRGASWFLGVAEWTFGALLFLGIWNKKLGVLGAAGSVIAFVCTLTIIPFMPNGWAASAGGFPAMVGNVAFLIKDVVLLAAFIYLLRQDALRVSHMSEPAYGRVEMLDGARHERKRIAGKPSNPSDDSCAHACSGWHVRTRRVCRSQRSIRGESQQEHHQ